MIFKIPELRVLLNAEDGDSVSDVAERCNLSYPTALKVLESFQLFGLCCLEKDGRKKILKWTERGQWLREFMRRFLRTKGD